MAAEIQIARPFRLAKISHQCSAAASIESPLSFFHTASALNTPSLLAKGTFNAISVDSDTSTSDTVALVSSARVPCTDLGAFERGLVRGLTNDAAATVVGVQTQSGDRTIGADWYAKQHLTYVSDIDQVEGRVSLVYALAGVNTAAAVSSASSASSTMRHDFWI